MISAVISLRLLWVITSRPPDGRQTIVISPTEHLPETKPIYRYAPGGSLQLFSAFCGVCLADGTRMMQFLGERRQSPQHFGNRLGLGIPI
jgi:hypothetical protein